MTSTAASSAPQADSSPSADDAIRAAAERIMAQGESRSRAARDPVNAPMINNWVEALGDANPVYTDADKAAASVHGGLVAPPAMAQVWTMAGLNPQRDPSDPLYSMMAVLDEAGFTSVVATNCDQTYHRYLHHGEHVEVTTKLDNVVGPKRTGLGVGWFVTTRNIWYVGEEPVAEMLFRVLKFKPAGSADTPEESAEPEQSQKTDSQKGSKPSVTDVIRPAINKDTEYFWEGTAAGELRIQRCGQCGLLRHPPGPMCPECGATKPTYFLACGMGEVYSYVVHHRPAVPGKELPLVVALVELDEGVRILGEMHGVHQGEGADPEEVHIGQRVEVSYQQIDDTLTLPCWRPVKGDEN